VLEVLRYRNYNTDPCYNTVLYFRYVDDDSCYSTVVSALNVSLRVSCHIIRVLDDLEQMYCTCTLARTVVLLLLRIDISN